MTSVQETKPSRDRIDRLRLDVIKAMAVRAALQLDVFTPLTERAMTADELATTLGVEPRRLGMLLHQLAASDFLVLAEGRFANTAIAEHYFVRGQPDYYGGIHGAWTEHFGALMHTAESIRTDRPAAEIGFTGMTSDQLSGFLRGIHGMAITAGRQLAQDPFFASARRVPDVGGGSGGVAIGLREAHPALQATILDLPPVVPIAVEMAAEAGLSDRISGLAADILAAPPPAEFDVATARAFFQVLSEDQCRQAAHAIAGSLLPGGRLFLVGLVTGDSGLEPEISVAMNMVFLNTFENGQAHSESRHRAWLSEAGFCDIERKPFLAGYSLISAVKERHEFQTQ